MYDFETIVERLRSNRLWEFPGGIHPEDRKALSNGSSIGRPPLPNKLYLPLKQHVGTEGYHLVDVGQHVLKGEPLTGSNTPYSVPIHAPTSGTITAFIDHVSAHPSGLPERTLVLQPDGLDEWTQLFPQVDYASLEKSKLIAMICEAGISGMGGAGFPTHIKTSSRKETEFLVINGIECEPYITADDRLMREHAWQIRQGTDILQHIVTPKHIVIAIEDNKPEAIEAMQIAFKDKPDCSVVAVPTVYPAGGEKQLIQVVTGREVPGDGLPEDIGIMMFNVGTCYAVADAIFHGKPLIERVVTLTGEAANNPQNVWALLGTPVQHLAEFAQLQYSKRAETRIIMGGPMMGFTVSDPLVPVVKITNCLLMPKPNDLRQGEHERPCIRCSACADACPASLLPQQLYWHSKAKEYDKADDYNLFDCIECGACAYVCPSDIPLVQYYRQAKSAIRNERDEKDKSEKAKARFESRKQRLEQEKLEREEKHKKAAEARLAAQAVKAESGDKPAPKSAAVAAAIARAKAKKQTEQTQQNSSAETATEVVDEKKAKVAAAVARAKAKKLAEQNAQNNEKYTAGDKSAESAEVPAPTDAEADKKARIAAAVARAKAKKQAEQAPAEADEKAADNNTAASAESEASVDAESVKEARIAAAVAKAKARKQAEQTQSESEVHQDDAAEAEKKARIAAAVAKAKAKAKARAQEAASSGEEKE